MFLDPDKSLMIPRIGLKVAGKKLGFRTLMNVVPLRAELVGGSHGRLGSAPGDLPVFINRQEAPETLDAPEVYHYLLSGIFD